jgi:hypothetical protein
MIPLMNLTGNQKLIAIEEQRIVTILMTELNQLGNRNKIICTHKKIKILLIIAILSCIIGMTLYIISIMMINSSVVIILFEIAASAIILVLMILLYISLICKRINTASNHVKQRLEELGVTNITISSSLCCFPSTNITIDEINTQNDMLTQAFSNYY